MLFYITEIMLKFYFSIIILNQMSILLEFIFLLYFFLRTSAFGFVSWFTFGITNAPTRVVFTTCGRVSLVSLSLLGRHLAVDRETLESSTHKKQPQYFLSWITRLLRNRDYNCFCTTYLHCFQKYFYKKNLVKLVRTAINVWIWWRRNSDFIYNIRFSTSRIL